MKRKFLFFILSFCDKNRALKDQINQKEKHLVDMFSIFEINPIEENLLKIFPIPEKNPIQPNSEIFEESLIFQGLKEVCIIKANYQSIIDYEKEIEKTKEEICRLKKNQKTKEKLFFFVQSYK